MKKAKPTRRAPEAALAAWSRTTGEAADRPQACPDAGLINHTYLVGQPPRAVLQWINPVIDPRIHHDIEIVTERLALHGLQTPRLISTRAGDLWLDDDDGCWRLMTYMPGVTLHALRSPAAAAAAGDLVGRFHAAVAGWRPVLEAPRRDAHDTSRHMAKLASVLGRPPAAGSLSLSVLGDAAKRLGEEILQRWSAWQAAGLVDSSPERLCHGDLKISNLRFTADGQGLCLLDLDTLGSASLASEMGDAWRSWCNPAAEEDVERSRFDVELFAASAGAWCRQVGELTAQERDALVPAIERICLELASRFCVDIVEQSYFREDRQRFPVAGEHNLARTRGQLALAASARAQRSECERLLRAAAV